MLFTVSTFNAKVVKRVVMSFSFSIMMLYMYTSKRQVTFIFIILIFLAFVSYFFLQSDGTKTRKLVYPEHLPLTKIQAGLKSGRYLQVQFTMSNSCLIDRNFWYWGKGVLIQFSGDHNLTFFKHIIENGLPHVRSTLKNLHYYR